MSNLVPESWKDSLQRLSDKIGRFLDRFRSTQPADRELETITADRFPAFTQLGVPLLDMQETSDELIVTAEVPGLKKEDFTVELLGRRLTIKGEKKVAQERKRADGSMLAECRYGSFTRSLLLPYEVTDQEVTGDLSNGILTLRLKKPEAERGRRFRVPVS